MVSESNFTLDKEKNVMRSNYPTGANVIVAGSAVFNDDIAGSVKALMEAV